MTHHRVFVCLTFFLFPLPAGYSLCRHAPSAESFARSHWSVRPCPPVVPVIRAARVWQQLPSFHTSLTFSLPSIARYSSPPRTSLPFWERDLALDPLPLRSTVGERPLHGRILSVS